MTESQQEVPERTSLKEWVFRILVGVLLAAMVACIVYGIIAGTGPSKADKVRDKIIAETTPSTLYRVQDKVHGMPEEVVVAYRGHDLHCVDLVADFAGAYVCDFTRFYADNPGVKP